MNNHSRNSTVAKGKANLDSTSAEPFPDIQQQAFSILILDISGEMQDLLKKGVLPICTMLKLVTNIPAAEELLNHYHFDLLIADINGNDLQDVKQVKSLLNQTKTKVIFCSIDPNVDTVLAALRMGAVDFLQKPFQLEQMLKSVQYEIQRRLELLNPAESAPKNVDSLEHNLGGLIGKCEIMKGMCDVICQIAPTPSTVLLEGESGTGKEIVAQTIHSLSGRSGPFVPVHCASISPQLLESELFGHTKGAFTGAHQAREGLFNHASGGTLFLDEIGEMPLGMQVKLLRFMEEGTIRQVGANEEKIADVRIIAATNRTLADEVKSGNFREDLYFRLNVLLIHLPPLRKRLEDIPLLARHFSDALAPRLKRSPLEFSQANLEFFKNYDWPGNVRELKNLIERSLLLNLPLEECYQKESYATKKLPADTAGAAKLELSQVEKNHILKVLDAAEGNKSEASRQLGIARKTLERKLKEWNS
ncbi:MAG: sigma-54-dependent Fis family transcriptional regulator [SAR324 cluster bacterium]|nr:sigma-54-dependent Fis family transcriptional regulator [SAR324 cluster bacterium]MBL7034838.1 sigma-54-dependent Fis family transcriptional regulator [SAR324 cluster bacterium]